MLTQVVLLACLHKLDPHRSLTLPLEPFRFWLRIRGDIRNRKTTPRLIESGIRSADSLSRRVVFRLRISPRIRSQNRNGLKCSVRDQCRTNLCKNLGKPASLPCPFNIQGHLGLIYACTKAKSLKGRSQRTYWPPLSPVTTTPGINFCGVNDTCDDTISTISARLYTSKRTLSKQLLPVCNPVASQKNMTNFIFIFFHYNHCC
jgi:hypothetical protein